MEVSLNKLKRNAERIVFKDRGEFIKIFDTIKL